MSGIWLVVAVLDLLLAIVAIVWLLGVLAGWVTRRVRARGRSPVEA